MDIGELFLQRGLVTREQLGMAASQSAGRRIDCVLVETGMVNEEDALKTLAEALGLKFVDLQGLEVDRELLAKFPTSAVFRHTILPLARDNGKVRVATYDPFNLEALNELSALSGFRLDPVLARRDDVLQRIKEHLGVGGDTINELVARNVEEGVEIIGDVAVASAPVSREHVRKMIDGLATAALFRRPSSPVPIAERPGSCCRSSRLTTISTKPTQRSCRTARSGRSGCRATTLVGATGGGPKKRG